MLVVAAPRVGGLVTEATDLADFLGHNQRIQVNLLGAAVAHVVRRMLFLGSSCAYPKLGEQPIRESVLPSGPLAPASVPHMRVIRRRHG
jgi:GDP-L-fucose synthase